MAFIKNVGGNVKFAQLNFKHGTMIENTMGPNEDGEIVKKAVVHDGVAGIVKSLTVKPKVYEGVTTQQALLRFEDDFAISFNLGNVDQPNFGAAKLLGTLRNAELQEEMIIRIGKAEKGKKIGDKVVDKDFVWISVKQHDEKIPCFYDNEVESRTEPGKMVDGLPPPDDEKRNKDGSLKWADWSSVWDFMLEMVVEIQDKIAFVHGETNEPEPEPAKPATEKKPPKVVAKPKRSTPPSPDDDIPM